MNMHHASEAQKRAGALPPELRLAGLGIHAGLLPPQAAEWTAQWREKKARGEGLAHWIFAVMGFFGSQLLVWPLLALVGFLFWNMLSVPLVRLAVSGALLATGAFMLRPPVGMAHAQIGFAVLQAGLVALYLSLMMFGFMGPEDGLLPDTLGLIFLAVLTASAALAGPAWAQALLAAQATVVALGLFGRWTLFHDGFLSWSMGMPVYAINAAVLALAWAVLVASEGRVPGRHWLAAVQARCSPALTGMGVALVLCVAQVNANHFFAAVTLRKLASGSAEAGALAVPLLHLGLGAALQLALTLAAAGWLMRHWRLRQAGARSLGLFALAYGVLLLACFFIPLIGVVTLVGTVALGTHRRRLLALALFVLLFGLSGFYYALHWPLVQKAAVLAATGAALGALLAALRWGTASRRARQAWSSASLLAPAVPASAAAWASLALIALGTLAALALVRHDVAGKEAVIARGEKIYVALAPADPRSLMQGDYMALRFDLPANIAGELAVRENRPWAPAPRIVARLDARGVAQPLRVARPGETLAADERLLPVLHKNGRWTLVTDAYHFPEGRGRPFQQARYGEFRTLPDGRALLAGLADGHLQAIEPAPASQAWKEAEDETENKTQTREGSRTTGDAKTE